MQQEALRFLLFVISMPLLSCATQPSPPAPMLGSAAKRLPTTHLPPAKQHTNTLPSAPLTDETNKAPTHFAYQHQVLTPEQHMQQHAAHLAEQHGLSSAPQQAASLSATDGLASTKAISPKLANWLHSLSLPSTAPHSTTAATDLNQQTASAYAKEEQYISGASNMMAQQQGRYASYSQTQDRAPHGVERDNLALAKPTSSNASPRSRPPASPTTSTTEVQQPIASERNQHTNTANSSLLQDQQNTIEKRLAKNQQTNLTNIFRYYQNLLAGSHCKTPSGWSRLGEACQSNKGVAIKNLIRRSLKDGSTRYALTLFQGTFINGELGKGKTINIEFDPDDIQFNYAKLFSHLTKNPANVRQLLDADSQAQIAISYRDFPSSLDQLTTTRQQRLKQQQQQQTERKLHLQQQQQAQQQRVKQVQQQQQLRAQTLKSS